MAYTTNRLNEALKKLDEVDEAVGDLMSRGPSPTDNLKAARNHLGAAYALLDALLPDPTTPTEETAPCPPKTLTG